MSKKWSIFWIVWVYSWFMVAAVTWVWVAQTKNFFEPTPAVPHVESSLLWPGPRLETSLYW
jgi:hypothetical protein